MSPPLSTYESSEETRLGVIGVGKNGYLYQLKT